MIPFVGLALYAEGNTDHRFLEGIARRAAVATFTAKGVVAEVPEIQRLTIDDGIAERADRILNGATNEQGAFHILLIHADADGDADAAVEQRVIPGRELVVEALGEAGRAIVAVVPVRMTETWALVDGHALRSALSSRRSDQELGLPPLNQLEGMTDPKTTLDSVVGAAHSGGRRRRRRSGAAYLDELAETICLGRLRALPAFGRFEADLVAALQHLGHDVG